jgi:hypothetical protein
MNAERSTLLNETSSPVVEGGKKATTWARLIVLVALQPIIMIALRGLVLAQMAPLAPSASEIASASRASLNKLYQENEAARALGARAKAVLVFPNIRKGHSSSAPNTAMELFSKVRGQQGTIEPGPLLTVFRPASRVSDTPCSL